MPLIIIATFLGVLVMLFVFSLGQHKVRRRKKRQKVFAKPFPKSWISILEKNLPPYKHLSFDLKHQLHGYIMLFIEEKNFEGCGGQKIDDEIKVTVAAQACILLLNRDVDCYPKLKSILIYPDTYQVNDKSIFGNQPDVGEARLGESWTTGAVVLSWNSVKSGAINFDDGQNVTIHEFAHQLDQEDGYGDGAPILENRSSYRSWARILSTEFETLQSKSLKHEKTLMNKYGATNPAEFFAVASETFFEKPHQLKNKHKDLYNELANFYKINPLDWQ